MRNLKKEYKQLQKQYKKIFNKLNKTAVKADNYLEYFVLQLRFLRDRAILTEDLTCQEEDNQKIFSLSMAVLAYDNAVNCINEYYTIVKGQAIHRIDMTSEECLSEYNKKRQFYWDYFWNIVKQNMEIWGN